LFAEYSLHFVSMKHNASDSCTHDSSSDDGVLKIAICGAGAIGTLYGSLFIKGGHDVTFMDGYQPMLDDVLKDGNPKIKLMTSDDKVKEELPCKICHFKDYPKGVEFDFLILAVKASQSKATLGQIESCIGPKTVILTLQGAFDAAQTISSCLPKFPTNRLLYGCTTCCSTRAGNLAIKNYTVGQTSVWPLGTKEGDKPIARVQEVINLVNKTDFKMNLTPATIGEVWKMLLYYPTNIACSAVCNLDFSTVWNNQPMNDVLVALTKEIALIAKAKKVNPEYFNEQKALEAVRKLAVEEGPHHSGSMAQDMHNKRITEIEATSGIIIKMAEEEGIEVPYNRTIYGIVKCREENYGHELFHD